MSRDADLELLYDELTVFARRARELSSELHPGLSLVSYTVLSYIETRPNPRASDIAADWGLDKSTVSRQLTKLLADGLVTRTGERPGRRGQQLELTAAGQQALDTAGHSIRSLLYRQLSEWSDEDIAAFAQLVARFNELYF